MDGFGTLVWLPQRLSSDSMLLGVNTVMWLEGPICWRDKGLIGSDSTCLSSEAMCRSEHKRGDWPSFQSVQSVLNHSLKYN